MFTKRECEDDYPLGRTVVVLALGKKAGRITE